MLAVIPVSAFSGVAVFGLVFVVVDDTVTCGVPCPDWGERVNLES